MQHQSPSFIFERGTTLAAVLEIELINNTLNNFFKHFRLFYFSFLMPPDDLN